MNRLKNGKSMIIIGIIMIAFMFVLSYLVPLFYRIDPIEQVVTDRLTPPSPQALMGKDEFGRDLLARVMYGGRASLTIGLLTTFISTFIGAIIGMYSAWYPKVGHVLLRINDGVMAIPGILLAIAFTSVFGGSVLNIVISLTIISIPPIVRQTRSKTLEIKNQSYIEAMKIVGASSSRIIWKHIFPNVIPVLLVQGSFIFAGSIISEASLSYLGAGIPAPMPSWGNIIQGGRAVVFQAPWIILFPTVSILISVMGFNVLGEGLRVHIHNQES